MKLYTGITYWDKTLKKDISFPSIEKDISSQILIVGAGMSGNLAAYVLANSGYQVSIVEKSLIGRGSSSANTGLLQYSSDIMLSELRETIGEENAVLFYKMSLEAMEDLTILNKDLNSDTDYRLRDSIYYASNREDAEKLKKEYYYLEKYNFPVEFIDGNKLKNKYSIDKDCALRTWKDAEVNPYKFIRALVDKNIGLGVKYFENTSIDLDRIGENQAYTDKNKTINYEHVLIATGYSKVYDPIRDKARIDRTYAFSAKTLKTPPWKDKVMVWETKDPYLYFRTAKGNRIIAGGLDEHISHLQEDEDIIYKKTEAIKREIEGFFPDLHLDVDYRWNALFGSSKDGLPFIGPDPIEKNKYYLLGYEGNGTCYSMAGANILKDLIGKKENLYASILRIDR